MAVKLIHLLVLSSIPFATMAGSDSSDVDISFLNYLVTEAKKSHLNDGKCSGQVFPDTNLGCSAITGDNPALKLCGRLWL